MKSEAKFKKDFRDKLLNMFSEEEIEIFNVKDKRSDPDMIILGSFGWAALEFKKHEEASQQPNQDLKIKNLKKKGYYASFVFPENEKEVLNDLEKLFTT